MDEIDTDRRSKSQKVIIDTQDRDLIIETIQRLNSCVCQSRPGNKELAAMVKKSLEVFDRRKDPSVEWWSCKP